MGCYFGTCVRSSLHANASINGTRSSYRSWIIMDYGGRGCFIGHSTLVHYSSFWEAWHRDRQSLVLVSFLLAWGIIIISHLLESSHHYDSLLVVESAHSVDLSHHEEDHEHSMISVIFASLGGLGLMFARLLNIKEKREALVECCS